MTSGAPPVEDAQTESVDEREALVQEILAKIREEDEQGGPEPGKEAIRDRLLAEIYATIFRLEQGAQMLAAVGPGGLMRMIMGSRRGNRRRLADATEVDDGRKELPSGHQAEQD